jgi:hypothetical protein
MATLTQIRTFNTAHLAEAAPQWAGAADNWTFHTSGALQDVSTLGWEGLNSAASVAHMEQVHSRALTASSPVVAASELVAAAASELTVLQSRVMTIVSWCLEGAYWVGEDLKLTDMFRSPNAAVYKMRSQIQDWLESMLSQAANDLVTHDQAVASALDGHAQMLDNNCLTPDQIRRKLTHDAVKGGIPGAIGGGVVGGIPGLVVGGVAGAMTNDLGDLIDLVDGTTKVCEK